MIGEVALAKDEYLRPGTTMADLAKLKPAFATMGEEGGFDAVAMQRYPQVETIHHVHTAGNSSGIVDGAAAMLVGSKRAAKKLGVKPRARIVGFASIGSEPDDHAHRTGRREPPSAETLPHEGFRHRPLGDQRGVRGGRSALPARHGTRRPTR